MLPSVEYVWPGLQQPNSLQMDQVFSLKEDYNVIYPCLHAFRSKQGGFLPPLLNKKRRGKGAGKK